MPWPLTSTAPTSEEHDDETVLADGVAERTQAVAVEGGADADAVGEDQAGGAVPGLHERGVVAVEAADLGIEVHGVLPCLGHEHGQGVADVAPAPGQQLEGLVELPGVRRVVVEHGPEERLRAEAGLLGAEHRAGQHPVAVALDGVDLAVVADRAEGLGPLPGGQRVGREPLVEDREGGLVGRIGQVPVEVGQVVGRGQALVDDRPVRAGDDVEAVDAGQMAADPVGGDLVAVGAVDGPAR